MVTVPLTTEEASPAFLTDALRSGGAIGSATKVAEVEHEPIGVGVGIIGQLARLQLRYQGDAAGAPGTVVIKLPSQFPENRAVGDHFNFYEREGRFYQQMGDKLPLRIPRCYWNHIDPATGTFGLLLEDLGARTTISQVAGMGPGRARQALIALGRLHGTWWASPALDSLTWMPTLVDPVNLAAGQQYRDAWPMFCERVGDELPDGSLALGERVRVVYEDLLRDGMATSPTTIVHGDFRADNLLFDDDAPETEHVAVLDWQITYRGPGVGDLAYLLCQSLTAEDRRAHERDLFDCWYGAVVDSAGPLPGYPPETAWREYCRSVVMTTVYPVTAVGALDPANERGRELVLNMARRAFTAALDLGGVDLLG